MKPSTRPTAVRLHAGESPRVGRRPRRLRRWLAAVTAVLAVAAGLSLTPVPATPAASASTAPFRIVGTIPFKTGGNDTTAPVTVADSRSHKAFALVGTTIRAYDIANSTYLGEVSAPSGVTQVLSHVPVVDEVNGRVFIAENQQSLDPVGTVGDAVSADCGVTKIYSLDEDTLQWTAHPLPCFEIPVAARQSVETPVTIHGFSYYAPENKLMMMVEPAGPGTVLPVTWATPAGSARNTRHPMYLWQVDATPDPQTNAFSLDWQVELTEHCETNINRFPRAPIASRVGQAAYSYCYVGRQGRSVMLALDESGRPATDSFGDPVLQVSPTVGGTTSPLIDPGSGRLLIQEEDRPLGPAIWVYDPPRERFYGVIPSGATPVDQGVRYDFYRGFDTVNGRAYILNRKGLVAADVRVDPLPGGLIDPILESGAPRTPGSYMLAIDGNLRRILVPDLHGTLAQNEFPGAKRFVVVEDRLPPFDAGEIPDPDRGTADVPEVDGATSSAWSSGGSAFGVHAISVGGAANVINNIDPLCLAEAQNVRDFYRDHLGRCPAERLLTSGNREYFFAPASIEFGSESGSVGAAAAASTSTNDSATDSDLRSIGACGVDRVPREIDTGLTPSDLVPDNSPVVPLPVTGPTAPVNVRELLQLLKDTSQGAVDSIFGALNDPENDPEPVEVPDMVANRNLRDSAQGGCALFKDSSRQFAESGCGADRMPEPGRTAVSSACTSPVHEYDDGVKDGFPSPLSLCTDFTGVAAGDQERDLVGTSRVVCDFAKSHTVAESRAAGTLPGMETLPLPDDVAFSVADARTLVETRRTAEGIVTVSRSTLDGVVIGPFSIGHIESEVRTVAHGQSGTTSATFRRDISQVTGPGIEPCADDCTDEEKQFVDGFNAFFQGRAWARLPKPSLTASPKGFQAVGRKDPGLELSDRVVNDDDTQTFNALDIMFINDVGFNPQATTSAGKSRLVLGFAGVQSESRYGIFPLPTFPEFTFSDRPGSSIINPTPLLQAQADVAPPQVAGETITIIEGGAAQSIASGGPTAPLLPQGGIAQLLRDGWTWFVNHPAEAFLLLGVMTILLAPIYFAIRRRVLHEALFT